MSSVKCDSAVRFGFTISLILIFRGVVIVTSAQSCSLSSEHYCNDLVVKYPFWYDWNDNLNVSDYQCGYPGFGIQCTEDRAVMHISNQLFHVSNINYTVKLLTVKEMDTEGQECPHPRRNISLQEFGSSLSNTYPLLNWTLFYNCSDTPNNKDVEKYHLGCLDNSGRRSYAFPGEDYTLKNGFNWYGNCEEALVVPSDNINSYTIDAKTTGYNLKWSPPQSDCENCENSGGRCIYNRKGGFKCACGSDFTYEFDKPCFPLKKGQSVGVSPSNQPTLKSNQREKGLSTGAKVLIGVFIGVGVLLLLVLLIYRRILLSIFKVFASHWGNNIKGRPTNVEMFLERYGHLTVQRYKYSDIKKITNTFKEILGEGGYGSVFKGKLNHEGRLVAVKLLNEAKGNGEDFINEVATISRTNHVNVVSLLGFCTDGTKRALVYEFMPNGSLEKFIYNEKRSSTPLGWEKLYQIALGIARGLEYLHRGCNTRILHLDIKPHNILLDQDFCPKISDFGLAKLCPTRESVVSMLVARGTIGYIAPEVYCRNFGGVSHKSDVYSYGMMVLEIVGGRKNIDATVDNISEIYFPQWVYNHLNQGVNLEGSKEIFEDETTRKMILVALWCIQRQPSDRPSISKVVEMLEGNTGELQMPPNPFEDFPISSLS